MKRIIIAVGSLAVLAVLGVGAVSVLTASDDSTPGPTTAAPTDASRPFDREALEEQAEEQAQQKQAAVDELAERVREEAERANEAE